MEEMQKQTENVPLAEPCAADGDKDRPAFCNKFATSDELERAYDNLQREFTKKCQQNSELTRALAEARESVPSVTTNESGEPAEERPQGRDKETPTALNASDPTTPRYELPDWDERVQGFMQKYPSAERYFKEMAKELATDSSLAMRDDCLEQAYFNVLRKSDRPLEELARDEDFLEKYVYGNEKVKDRIIEEFLLKHNDVAAPRTIAASGRTHVTPPSRPKSIREAGGIVKNMLEHRRI